MYFSALRRVIQSVEEKKFYDIARFYLHVRGFKDISIVDGSGDGGKDVITSMPDLRIQLSVRSKWQEKINEEVLLARSQSKRHFMYVTNRLISVEAEEKFRQVRQVHKGEVDVSIHDLNRIATALAQPGAIRRAYEILGLTIIPELKSTLKDIALSTMLLFSREAKELREHTVESFVRAWLLNNPGNTESDIISIISESLPGADNSRHVRSALSRLRSAGRIVGKPTSVKLSSSELKIMQAAEIEYQFSTKRDIDDICCLTGLELKDARILLAKAIELLSRNRSLTGMGPAEEDLRSFLARHRLTILADEIYDCLSTTTAAKRFQFGETIEHIFSTNTFDIYRALGDRTNISVALDTSVALPMIFGIEFGTAESRYSMAATALKACCKTHNFKIVVPRSYLNEMASHGLKALENIEGYDAMAPEAKKFLRSSKNAYLSHYTHIAEALAADGIELSLSKFLAHFGILPKKSLRSVENRIMSLLDRHAIELISDPRASINIKKEIAQRKPNEIGLLVDHDARVATLMSSTSSQGFIFATWDKVLIEVVENIVRVFAEQPSRIIDVISSVEGIDLENERSFELHSALIHIEDRRSEKVAKQIERIKTAKHAFLLQTYIDGYRNSSGKDWSSNPKELAEFLDAENVGATEADPEADVAAEKEVSNARQ